MYLALIKQHLASQKQLAQILTQADSLLEWILGQEDFFTSLKSPLRDAFLTASQLLKKARMLSEELIPASNKITPLLLPFKPSPD